MPKSKVRGSISGGDLTMPRTSVSFPPEVYQMLGDLAAQKKVSIGWVVREAVEKYLGDQCPLFGTSLLKAPK